MTDRDRDWLMVAVLLASVSFIVSMLMAIGAIDGGHPAVVPVRPPLTDLDDKVTLSNESLSKISQEVWRLLEQHEAVKAAEIP